jgi:leucyl aminopeptidase (aminopeptidase T)
VSSEWNIDTIVHALPFPEMRQKALREIHLAPVGELQAVVDRWRDKAIEWSLTAAPRVEEARTHFQATGELPAQYEETSESAARFDDWRKQMEALRQERGAA